MPSKKFPSYYTHYTPYKNMIAKLLIFQILFTVMATRSNAQTNLPSPVGPVPTANQLRWQQMEYYAFIHFSTNTFTGQEWGFGSPEDAKLFNPTNLDCEQWAQVCKNAGMKGIIITAKHHSGFCLWPTETTTYSVKNSPWKNGKGDIIGDLAKACKKYGLKLGIYISPWDRHDASYGLLTPGKTAPYVENVLRKQISECLTRYGNIFEIWFDGANGGDGYYGGANTSRKIDRTTYYEWPGTYKLIRQLQPEIVIWNDNGDRADLRWVGTESGYVGETNWSLLNATGDVPEQMLRYGVENGNAWVPGEVNTSIRPGWFYHEYEDQRVKNLPVLMETYYKSIGRNGTFLLNFPIDKRGLIHENDQRESAQLAAAVKEAFAVNLATSAKVVASNVRGGNKNFAASNVVDDKNETYWATDDTVKNATLTLEFGKPTSCNRFLVQEYIRLGQRVKQFRVEAMVNDQWVELRDQLVPADKPSTTTIGYKRIIGFPTVIATRIRLTITDTKASAIISNIGVYNAPQILTSPEITRSKSGQVSIVAADKESEIYYTVDGSTPTISSTKYTGPINGSNGKLNIRAIAYDKAAAKSSVVATEQFDIAKTTWKVIEPAQPEASKIIDGDIRTNWFHPKAATLPSELVIDLGNTEQLTGFRYLPADRGNGIITHYEFAVSQDGKDWKTLSDGEFANIRNNPLWQTKNFGKIAARFIKFKSLKNTGGQSGYAELDIITD